MHDLNRPSKEDSRIVYVVNTSATDTFVDMWDGDRYVLRPKTKVPVPRYVAKHWLGNPEALGSDWGKEINRLRNKHGVKVYSLIERGTVFCPEFGVDHLKKLQSPSEEARAVIVGTPLEENENPTSGAVALSESEFEDLKNRFENGLLGDNLDNPYNVDEEFELV